MTNQKWSYTNSHQYNKEKIVVVRRVNKNHTSYIEQKYTNNANKNDATKKLS